MPATLLPFSPDNALHGADVTLQVMLASGAYLTIGELFDFKWDEDQGMVKVPAFGSRLDGMRRGRFSVNGTFTGYYINGVVRSMIQGYATPATAGVTSAIYHSQAAFQRYFIQVNTTNASITNIKFINVTLGKDAMSMASDKLVDEVVTWSAEDVLAS